MSSPIASPTKCSATTKATGLPCKNEATYLLDGQHFCGVHIEKDRKEQAEAISRSKSRSTSTIITFTNVCEELDKAIARRISVRDIGDLPEDRLMQMITMPEDHRRIIIKRATELAGTQDNVALVMARLPVATSDFLRAFNEKRMKIVYRSPYLSTIENSESIFVNRKARTAWLEDGHTLKFGDVDIMVANCSKPYLDAMGIKTIDELCNDGDVIYMGPRGALISPIGIEIPTEDSEWYIPLPPEHKLRITHNPIKTQQILQDIKNGTDTADKYLALRGKILACVCLPYPCHCLIYVEVVRALQATATLDTT